MGEAVPRRPLEPSAGDVRRTRAGIRRELHPDHFFSVVTAAVLHRIWLPLHLERELVLDVGVRPGHRQPRGDGVRGHLFVDRPGLVVERDGLRLTSLHETWCQLAAVLGLDDLIIAGESVLAKNRPDRLTLDRLAEALAVGGRPRQRLLERALAEVRPNVRSAMETRLRRLIVADGLPEPEINVDVVDAHGWRIKECDLVYRRWKVAIEYEGGTHFVDEAAERRDALLYERLHDVGWRVVRVMKEDMRSRRAEIPRRLRAAIAAQQRRGVDPA